jgi:hypothetical protein
LEWDRDFHLQVPHVLAAVLALQLVDPASATFLAA